MKRILLVAFASMLYACNGSAEANLMADEICMAMEKYTYTEPMSKFDAANDLNLIRKNQKYSHVTDAQLKKIMMKKCPGGWNKYSSIKDK